MSTVIYFKNPSFGKLWLDWDYRKASRTSFIFTFSMLKVHAEHHEVDHAPWGRAQSLRVLLLPRGQDAAHHTHYAQPHDIQVVSIRDWMHFLFFDIVNYVLITHLYSKFDDGFSEKKTKVLLQSNLRTHKKLNWGWKGEGVEDIALLITMSKFVYSILWNLWSRKFLI